MCENCDNRHICIVKQNITHHGKAINHTIDVRTGKVYRSRGSGCTANWSSNKIGGRLAAFC